MAMRATAENIQIASLLGINVDTVFLLTFAVASALAGVAGVLVGMNFNAISPFMGFDMGIKAMAVMVIGGLGSIYGAMVGGMILGIAEVLSVAYFASSLRDAFAFGLMVLMLDRAAPRFVPRLQCEPGAECSVAIGHRSRYSWASIA